MKASEEDDAVLAEPLDVGVLSVDYNSVNERHKDWREVVNECKQDEFRRLAVGRTYVRRPPHPPFPYLWRRS